MQIVNIKAKDFKGISFVEVAPKETVTIIGGKNRAGKSSLLDAIAAAIGGKKLCPAKPIKEGKESAVCQVELDGDPSRNLEPCIVKRTFKRGKDGSIKSDLTITTKKGFRASSPQKICDDIVGSLGFDPEAFLRMDPKKQAEVLRELVGLDFTKLDEGRAKLYEERTRVNNDGKKMKARFEAMPHHQDAPDKEVSVSSLLDELQRRQRVNRDNGDSRDALAQFKETARNARENVAQAEQRVEEIKRELELQLKKVRELKDLNIDADKDVAAQQTIVDALEDLDEEEVQEQISASEEVNRKVRENVERDKLEKELEAERKKSADLTDQIESIDTQKQKMRTEANWPVEGLGYDDSGVTLFDRPFSQASAKEQREAAFGIVAALSPALKFCFIKDASLLDDEAKEQFAEMAAKAGFQLFLEVVGEGDDCTIIISDGEVKDNAGEENDEGESFHLKNETLGK